MSPLLLKLPDESIATVPAVSSKSYTATSTGRSTAASGAPASELGPSAAAPSAPASPGHVSPGHPGVADVPVHAESASIGRRRARELRARIATILSRQAPG